MAASVMMPSFGGGELSTNLYARVDLDKYHSGAALLRNFFVDYRGGVANRPGSKYLATAPTGTVRIIPFIVSRDQSYILLFSNLQVKVYLRGALVSILTAPYAAADLFDIKYVQSADVMTLTHPSYPVYNINRTSATDFNIAAVTYGAGIDAPASAPTCTPTVVGTLLYVYCVTALSSTGEESLPSPADAGASVALDPTNATPRLMKLTWPAVAEARAYNIYKAGPVQNDTPMPTVFGYIGQSQVASFTDNNIGPDFSITPPQHRDPFSPGQITAIDVTAAGTGADPYTPMTITGDGTGASAYAVAVSGAIEGVVIQQSGIDYTSATAAATVGTGATFTVTVDPNNHYPACVTYFQQRRCFAGADVSPDLIEMSKTGFYNNFDVAPSVLDSDAITVNIASREVNNIEHMVPMSTGLVVFTRGNAFLLTGGGSSAAVTPANVAATPQASTGAGPLQPIVVNYNILFQQYEGTVIRDMTFQWTTNSYFGTDRSMLANHLFFNQTLVDWAFAFEPYHTLHVVRADGQMIVMTYVPEQDVYGWAHWDTQGQYKSVAAIPEDGTTVVYALVERHVPNENGDPCWVTFLERFAEREDCCIYEDWFLDAATALPETDIDSDIYVTGDSLNDVVTITSYDPCVSPAPSDGPFTSASYTLEALENYDPTRVAEVDGSGFTTPVGTDTTLLGQSVDLVRRKLRYPVYIQYASATNDTGHTLWTGESSIAPSAALTSGNLSLWLAEKDIDTGAVTFTNVYDPAAVVPSGIGGGDGTWRRTVFDVERLQDLPLVTDPRTGNVWVQTESCELHCFRASDSYTMTLSPLISGDGNQIWNVGMNDDWSLAMEQAATPILHLVPRLRTDEETTEDKLLSYADFNFPVALSPGSNPNLFSFGNAADKTLWMFVETSGSTPAFTLYKCEMPTSAPWGGPVVGGGWTTETPWSAGAGPDLLGAGYHVDSTDAGRNLLMVSGADREILHYFSRFEFGEYQADPSDISKSLIIYTQYDTGTGSYYVTNWLEGYLSSSLETVSDPADAAYWIDGFFNGETSALELDPYYTTTNGYLPSTRWLIVQAYPVSGGTVGSHPISLLVELQFVNGAAPTIVRFFDSSTTWTPAYASYSTALSTYTDAWGFAIPDVVAANQSLYNNAWNQGYPNWFFDRTANAFYAGTQVSLTVSTGTTPGSTSSLYIFEAPFSGRATVADADPPIMKLSFAERTVGVGDVIHITEGNYCGKISITAVNSSVQMTGTVIAAWDGDVPFDSTATLPISSGGWFLTTPTQVFTGLSYLEGKTVYALADGKVVGPLTVSGGEVDLGFSASSALVGLTYTSEFQSLRLDVGEPTIQGRRKVIPAVTLRVKCSVGFEVGTTDFSTMYQPKTQYPPFLGGPAGYTAYTQGGAAAVPYTGDIRVNVQAGWETDGIMTVRQSLPLPVTILGLIPEITVGDNQR